MLSFRVVPDDGEPYDLKATSRDIFVWERTTQGKSFSQLMDNLVMVDLYKIAYLASRRLGHFDGTEAQFTESVDLTGGFQFVETDPTPPAP